MDKVKFGEDASKLFVPLGIMPEHVTLRVIAQSALQLKDDRQSGLINKKKKQQAGLRLATEARRHRAIPGEQEIKPAAIFLSPHWSLIEHWPITF